MTLFFQQLVNGIVIGAVYALIALGYTMVYGVIQLINFAHGEVMMIGAFGGLTVYNWLPASAQSHAYITLPLVLAGGMVASVVVAAAMERLAYRPLRNAPRLAPLITAIGISLFLREFVRLKYPGALSPLPFPTMLPDKSFSVGGVDIQYIWVFIVVLAIGLMVGLETFVRRSRTGRAMRAVAQDPDTARLMGVDVNRIIVITFVIGGALAAVAGVMQGAKTSAIDPFIGFIAGLKAFTAAVLGGIGNITGAAVGGFIIGIVEAMATQYIPSGSTFSEAWVFVVLILVLVFRPTGLLGEDVAVRA